MTGAAVVVDSACQLGVRNTIVAGISLMFVFVMAEVLGCGVRFVLAIAGYCRPGELERQKNEQEDGKPTAHTVNSSSDSDDGPSWSRRTVIRK